MARARHDNRISGGAFTGSGSIDALYRWSDVDLAFGVRDRDQLLPTLEDFTQFIRDGPGAIDTVDVRRDPWIYRVFLLPNTLQVDLAMAPATDFGARTPSFRLAFGEARDAPHVPQPDPRELIGDGWLYALHGRWRRPRLTRFVPAEALSHMAQEVTAGGLEKPSTSDREAELRRLKEAMASHEPALLATARFLFRQEADARDLVQQTFETALRHLDELHDE